MRKPSWALNVMRKRIAAELHQRHLSQRELAEAVGISRPWLSNFLRGKVALSFADADAIADYLGVHLSELIQDNAGT